MCQHLPIYCMQDNLTNILLAKKIFSRFIEPAVTTILNITWLIVKRPTSPVMLLNSFQFSIYGAAILRLSKPPSPSLTVACITRCGALRGYLEVKFDSFNNLLISVHTMSGGLFFLSINEYLIDVCNSYCACYSLKY